MKIMVYSGTHWDREWYKSFQGFRYMLVHMTDELIDDLEKTEDYNCFHFDGQTVVLEDYLAIRPENKARLEKLIRDGKIVIGPWFCMPDEFLLSGESLIQNLKMGMRIARDTYGVEPAKNAYICDIFGHAAQTPQIFAGLDLNHTVLGRGTNEFNTPMYFRWQAPDGTEILAIKLQDKDGYGDFTAYARQNPLDEDPEAFEKNTRAYIDREIARSNIPAIFLLDATDHLHMRPSTGEYLRRIQAMYPDAEVLHINIDDADNIISGYKEQMPVRTGELNESGRAMGCAYIHQIANTLSSRYPLKSYNDRMQTRIEKWMSPAYAFGLTKDAIGFLNLAYKYLITNHPHDSICGCSIDQVPRDMMYRFSQTDLISQEVITTAAKPLSEGTGEKKLLRVFNPLPYAQRRNIEATVEFEKEFPTYKEPFGYENIHAFLLKDAQGNEIPYGIKDIRVGIPGKPDTYIVTFDADLLPMGVNEYELVPMSVPTRYPVKLPGTVRSAEGNDVSVEVSFDGSITLTDKVTGSVYPNLLQLVDDGEIGDGWFAVRPVVDRVVTCNTAYVEKVEDNTVRVTFRVVQQMRLPRAMTLDHGSRRAAQDMVDFEVQHFITVTREGRRVFVRTVIENNVCDHRLRLRLATGIEGEKYYASEAFCFVERTCGDRPETANWKEYGVVEKATSGIVFKQNPDNPKQGLAIISAYGVHECGVWANGNIDLTLLRAFTRTVQTEGEPEGELQQTLEYSFELIPLREEKPFAMLQREQDFLASGLRCGTGRADHFAETRSLCALEDEHLIYSTAAKLSDTASELRVVNFADEETAAVIRLPEWAVSASLTEIDGRLVKELPVKDGSVSFPLRKWGIATVRFER